MRPIKWKGILHRITIWNQKMSQYNSIESAMKMGLIFSYFEDYSKSARGMILFLLVTCYTTPLLYKNAEKPTVMWFFTQISWWILFFSSCIKKISLENMNEKNQEIFGLNDSSDDQFWRKPSNRFQRSAAASNSSVFFVTMFNLGGRVEMMTDG